MSQRKAKEYRRAMEQYNGVAEDVDDLKRRVGALEARHYREDRDKAVDMIQRRAAAKKRAEMERERAMKLEEHERKAVKRRAEERRRRIARRRLITLALAVAEVESHFDMDAVGAAGEVGIMQLNPGPENTYWINLEAETELDPTTPSGNIAAGCYLLGKYMQEYGDANKAAMAYNMGVSGAENAWAEGITSTDYSTAVVEAMERWEVTVNAWNGI